MASQADSKRRSRVWIVVVAVVLVLFLIPAAIFYQRTKDIDDWTRDWVVRSLSERFASRVELGSIHVSAFPEMSATGENLTIYYHNRTDVPPLIHIQQFTFHLGFMGILRVPRHIRGVHSTIWSLLFRRAGRNRTTSRLPCRQPQRNRNRCRKS